MAVLQKGLEVGEPIEDAAAERDIPDGAVGPDSYQAIPVLLCVGGTRPMPVRHDDFAGDAVVAQRRLGRADARFQRVGLVQAGQDDGDEERRLVHAGIVARVRAFPGVVRSAWT